MMRMKPMKKMWPRKGYCKGCVGLSYKHCVRQKGESGSLSQVILGSFSRNPFIIELQISKVITYSWCCDVDDDKVHLLPVQVDVLLDRGCNSWSTNKGGESALDLACRFGHVHVRILSTVIELHVITNSYLSAFLKSGCLKSDQKKTGGRGFDPFTPLFCGDVI